mgnify:CR=1 FL=1
MGLSAAEARHGTHAGEVTTRYRPASQPGRELVPLPTAGGGGGGGGGGGSGGGSPRGSPRASRASLQGSLSAREALAPRGTRVPGQGGASATPRLAPVATGSTVEPFRRVS